MTIFMKYGSIVGDVTTPGLVGWIELNSFSWGASNSATNASGATGAAAGKVSVGDITIGKVVDAASVQLIKLALTGAETDGVIIQFDKQFYKDARGEVPGAGPQDYLQFTLDNTLVTSYSLSSDGNEPSAGSPAPAEPLDLPTESLSLTFAKLDIQYTGQTGVQDVTWAENT